MTVSSAGMPDIGVDRTGNALVSPISGRQRTSIHEINTGSCTVRDTIVEQENGGHLLQNIIKTTHHDDAIVPTMSFAALLRIGSDTGRFRVLKVNFGGGNSSQYSNLILPPKHCRADRLFKGAVAVWDTIIAQQQNGGHLLHNNIIIKTTHHDDVIVPTMSLRLNISSDNNKLYGREKEVKTILASWQRVVATGRPETCWVHGLSGSGKTALCRRLQSLIQAPSSSSKHHQQKCHRNYHYFISGKCEQFHHKNSSSVLLQALDQLGRQFSSSSSEDDIIKCLGGEATILGKVVPSFAALMSVTRSERSNQIRSSSFSFSFNDDDDDVSSVEDTLMLASERLTVAVQSFLQAFCTKDRPLVLFMDDLQWCDEESWKILSAILEGSELTHFLFLGGYRDEESDVLQQRLKTIFENKATTAATTKTNHKATINLPLQNLDIASINELVSDALSSDLEQTLALSEIVRNKTLGNPYFAIQFLTTLQAQGLLTYHYGIMQWKWDLGQVKIQTELSENVVDVVTTRIQMLDSNAKRLLKLGSCLGFVFELELLEKLYHDTDTITLELLKGKEEYKEDHPDTQCSSFETSLGICETRGFLQRSGFFCTFTHDRIQQSVYELLPEGKMDKIHFCIGTCLRTSFDIESNPRYLRLTMEQLNLGLSTLLESSSSDINNIDGERLSLIQLNYTAALSAKKHVGASATAEFLEKAIELSRKQDYKKEKQHYPLILNIYSMSAEVELSRGNIDQSLHLIGCILKMATCDMDQVRARIVDLQIQGFKQNYSLAIQQGRELLRILGEKLPSSSKLNVYLEYKKSRRLFRRLSDDDLEVLHRTGSNNKDTLDYRRELIVDILQTLATYGWAYDPQFLTLCGLRMAMVCAKGYSSDMAAGFGWYSAVLISFGEMKEAFRFEQLAFRKVEMGRSLPGTCQMLVALISHCFKPAALMLEPLVTAYRVGLEVGEVYFGCLDIAVYSGLYAFCGLPLDTLAADMRKFGGQIKLFHQNYALSYVVQHLHFANNLRGVSADPTDFSRDSMKQYNCFSDDLFLDEKDPSFLCNIYYTAFTSFLLGKLDQAKAALAKVAIGKVTRFSGCHYVNHMYRFIEGIVGFAIWRSSPKNNREYLRLARRVLREVQGLVEKNLMNCAGIYELLLAENATTLRHSKNKIEENIKPLYDKAIVTLSRNGFLHFAGIANELAGELFLRNADPFWGRHYLSQAYTLYSDWGATAKLDQLKQSHDFLNNSNTGRVSTNLHGRQRYNPELDSMKGSLTTSVLREMVANSVHN